MRKIASIFVLTLLSILLSSCSQSDSFYNKTSLKTFGYYVNNYPSDFWTASSTSRPSLSYNFELVFSGDISANDIISAKVIIKRLNMCWTLDPTQFDQTTNILYGYSFWYSSNTCDLPIGELTAEVVLSDGTELVKTIIMGCPGSKTNGDYDYVYNPDDETTPSLSHFSCKAIQRPIITSFEKTSTEITVNFKIIGDHVNNGYIWYYDSAKNYIGRSKYFRDPDTGTCYIGLNSGNEFYNYDGDSNTFISTSSTIVNNNTIISSTAFNSITSARVVVIDGDQYETHSTHSNFDYRAVSEL